MAGSKICCARSCRRPNPVRVRVRLGILVQRRAADFGDILGKIKDQSAQLGQGGAGSILDTLGKVLTQAAEGAREGAGRVSDATGARDILTKATGGQTPEDLIAKIKDLIANNQMAAGAAAGGLGGILLGTRTGRGLLGGAAQIGALALIGGLAYKALQNYQAGKPLITGASSLAAAPAGSGYEPEAMTNEDATLLLRAMIGASAADGRIDENEKSRIHGALEQSGGLTPEAKIFINAELQNPATPADLSAAVRTQEQAMQLYTAARVAIDVDSPAETAFLGELARQLGMDAKLTQYIDATARSASA